jgi:TRAP-type C4-dicarboxylate transport system permease small subunit
MAYFERVIHSLTRVCNRLAQCAAVAMMLIVVANIVSRILWRPIYGTYDVVMILGSIVVAFALGNCAVQRGHIAVDIVMDRFPQRVQAIVDSITGILGVGIFAIVAWQCWVYGTDMRRCGEVSMSVYIPLHPFIYGVSFGCALLCMVILVDLIKALTKAVSK